MTLKGRFTCIFFFFFLFNAEPSQDDWCIKKINGYLFPANPRITQLISSGSQSVRLSDGRTLTPILRTGKGGKQEKQNRHRVSIDHKVTHHNLSYEGKLYCLKNLQSSEFCNFFVILLTWRKNTKKHHYFPSIFFFIIS